MKTPQPFNRYPNPKKFSRDREIRKVRGELERNSFPRLQMLLLVMLTGLSGFIASYALLHMGIVTMWLRYLVTFAFAYLMFLGFLWCWLRTQPDQCTEFPDISGLSPSGTDHSTACHHGAGGDFSGGGASSTFDGSSDHISVFNDAGDTVGDALGAAADADELAIPLVTLILIATAALSSLFVIYSTIYLAPTLFAELLVDSMLSASLYHRLRGIETRHWMETAMRRTALPFILAAVMTAIAGWLMALYAPEAHSIGDVLVHLKSV
jgi:hypothetical protein